MLLRTRPVQTRSYCRRGRTGERQDFVFSVLGVLLRFSSSDLVCVGDGYLPARLSVVVFQLEGCHEDLWSIFSETEMDRVEM